MRTTLTIAVPEHLARLPTESGVGRIWVRTLKELSLLAEVRLVEERRAIYRRRTRADVWLHESTDEALPTNSPVVTIVHEASFLNAETIEYLNPAFLKVIEPAIQQSIARASQVITISENTRREVIDHHRVAPERVHVAYPGVDADVFHPMAAQRAPSTFDAPYVLFASSIHPRKNLAGLRRAMVGLAERGLPHGLVIVGAPAYDRPDSTGLERELLGELPGWPGRVARVTFPVSEARLAGLMAGAEAFCLPSFMEGFGIPVLEAMACGTAPVVSNRGALPEVVGECGIVVDPDPEAVEDALLSLLSDHGRRAELERCARARAAGFSWARTARKWLDICILAVP